MNNVVGLLSLENILLRTALGLLLGVGSNLLADYFLRTEAAKTSVFTHFGKRRLRWVVCILANALVGVMVTSPFFIVVFALFSVTAATDFETRLLPADVFIYGCVVASLFMGYLSRGVLGFRDVLVTQAICFGITTLSVAIFGFMDSGDIKMAMQFGAACGSLFNLYLGLLAMFVVGLAMLGVVLLITMRRVDRHTGAIKHASQFHVPVATWAWLGLVMLPVILKVGGGL